MSALQTPEHAPLSVLDVVPIPTGSTPQDAVRATIDLAREAEAQGYARYWLTEHHLNPGIAGSSSATLLAALAVATHRIRLGTAATLLGNYHLVQVGETFGTLDAVAPGRIDLGLGRSGAIPAITPELEAYFQQLVDAGDRNVDGLIVPAPARFRWTDRPRAQVQTELFDRHEGDTTDFDRIVGDLLDFFAGTSHDPRVGTFVAPPSNGAHPQVWVHGSSAGISASVAGNRGLPFGSNYHTNPTAVLEAIAEYRKNFRPSARLDRPYVAVSADVVVGGTEAEAERLSQGYAAWVHSIRSPTGSGAIHYPSPEEASRIVLDEAGRKLVHDRLATRFVGAPEQVVARLETLQRVTGADELLVTTITHDHAARVSSYRLLAEAWGARSALAA